MRFKEHTHNIRHSLRSCFDKATITGLRKQTTIDDTIIEPTEISSKFLAFHQGRLDVIGQFATRWWMKHVVFLPLLGDMIQFDSYFLLAVGEPTTNYS